MKLTRNNKTFEIQNPNFDFISKQSNEFSKDEANRIKDEVLKEYFDNHKKNDDINIVLKKVTLINSFYNTFIQNDELVMVAQHIVELDRLFSRTHKSFSTRIENGEINIVNFIAYYGDTKKLPHNIYSFASKYCSFHNSEKYPIVDSYAKGMIYFINKSERYCKNRVNTSMKSINDYRVFCEMYEAFIRSYAIKDGKKLSFKKVDEYLWFYATTIAKDNEDFKYIIRIDDSEKPETVYLKID